MVNLLIAKLLMSPVLAVYIIIPIVFALEFFFFFVKQYPLVQISITSYKGFSLTNVLAGEK